MKNNIVCWTLALLALSAIQACSDKMDTRPATEPAAVSSPAQLSAAKPQPAAAQAEAQASLAIPLAKTATLQCEERNINLEAKCLDLYGPHMLACTSQRLTVSDSATGQALKVREFATVKSEGDDPALVEEQFGEIACVRTASDEKFIVATMDNGGNCEDCEWVDVYSWDGVLLGSEGGNRKKVAGIDAAVKAAFDKQRPLIGKTELAGFYTAAVKSRE